MPPLRMMVWGAGFFARKWLEIVKARPDCTLVGLLSRTPSRLEEVRRDLDLPDLPGYPTVDDALASTRADAVIIALPQMLHRDAIVKALQAGLHVLTEKPLAMSMAEALAILAASRALPQRVVMVNQNLRWRPHTMALRRTVREGWIGRPAHLSLECRQQIRRTTIDAWRENMAEPYLSDFAIHHFDLIRYVTGAEPLEVMGLSFRPPWSWFKGHAAAAAILTMEGGLVVDYGGTMVSNGLETPQEGVITITGDAGVARLDESSEVRVVGRDGARVVPTEPVPRGELGHGLDEFVSAIATRRLPETHLGDNIRSFAIVEAIMESAHAGRTVRIADLLAPR